MKVKFSESKCSSGGLTEGKVYNVINYMPSATGGFWGEVMSDIGIEFLIKIGGSSVVDGFGKWEVVSED